MSETWISGTGGRVAMVTASPAWIPATLAHPRTQYDGAGLVGWCKLKLVISYILTPHIHTHSNHTSIYANFSGILVYAWCMHKLPWTLLTLFGQFPCIYAVCLWPLVRPRVFLWQWCRLGCAAGKAGLQPFSHETLQRNAKAPATYRQRGVRSGLGLPCTSHVLYSVLSLCPLFSEESQMSGSVLFCHFLSHFVTGWASSCLNKMILNSSNLLMHIVSLPTQDEQNQVWGRWRHRHEWHREVLTPSALCKLLMFTFPSGPFVTLNAPAVIVFSWHAR